MKPALIAFSALFLFATVGCFENIFGPTATASPSPGASPVFTAASPSPAAPVTVDIRSDINVYDESSRVLVDFVNHGQAFILKSSLTCADHSTHLAVDCPFVLKWQWSSYSDPSTQCGIFGEVTTDHPHGKCLGDGYFIVQTVAITYDGVEVGQSPIYSLPVGTAAASSDHWRRLN